MKTVHLLIKGKVQGVFFRATAKEKAEQLQIKGWVKNTSSGDVEMMATGNEAQLDEFIQWCHKGPARARVTEVIVDEKEPEIFDRFSIER